MKGILLSCILIFGLSTIGFSCICRNIDFPIKYLAANDSLSINKRRVIIKGKVIKKIDSFYSKYHLGIAHNVRVLEYWPSNASLPDTLTIIDDDPYCPVEFEKDSTYLIAGFSLGRYIGTSNCLGTGLVSRYENHIIALGPGKKSEDVAIGQDKTDIEFKSQENNNFILWALCIILFASLIANIYFVIQLKKKL